MDLIQLWRILELARYHSGIFLCIIKPSTYFNRLYVNAKRTGITASR